MQNKKKITVEERLDQRCEALEQLIQSIEPYYKNATENQKAFLETIIGAGIWYLPHGKKYWNKQVSIKAIESLKNKSKSRLTRDHIYPRKESAKRLFKEIISLEGDGKVLKELYVSKIGKYILVTPKENRALISAQKDNPKGTWEDAYKKAKIELVDYEYILESEEEEFIQIFKKSH